MRWLGLMAAGWCGMLLAQGAERPPAAATPKPAAEKAPELPVEAGKEIEGLPMLVDPKALPEQEEPPTAEKGAPVSVEQAEKRVGRARQKFARWQKLASQGVIAKVELEACEVEVVVAELGLRRSRLADARTNAPENVASCEQQCAEAAKAVATLKLTLARRNLERYRKLLAAHLATKFEVQRAAALVEQLEAEEAKAP